MSRKLIKFVFKRVDQFLGTLKEQMHEIIFDVYHDIRFREFRGYVRNMLGMMSILMHISIYLSMTYNIIKRLIVEK